MTDDQHIDSKVEEYADIRPYDDHQFHDKIAALNRVSSTLYDM